MDLEDHDIENLIVQDEDAMMELAIALSLRQGNQSEVRILLTHFNDSLLLRWLVKENIWCSAHF